MHGDDLVCNDEQNAVIDKIMKSIKLEATHLRGWKATRSLTQWTMTFSDKLQLASKGEHKRYIRFVL